MIALLLFACIEPARRPLSFPMHFDGISDVVEVPGGTLRIETATLGISDLHLQEAPSPSSAWSFSLVSSAYAHPGHGFSGNVRGELIGEWTLDLLASAELGTAEGYEGAIVTGSVLLDGGALALTGVFEHDGGTVPVDLRLAIDTLVTDIPLELELDADAPPNDIVLRLDAAHALSFSIWEDTDGDGAITVADNTLTNTLNFGFGSTGSWTLEEIP